MRFFEQVLLGEGIDAYAVLAFEHTRPYTTRLAEALPFRPRTVILLLLPYFTGAGGNLSRYAVSRDYHLFARELGGRLSERLDAHYRPYTFRLFADHSPIDERHAALASGLGMLGKNGLLINDRYGSYVFLSEILTDMPPEQLGAREPQPIRPCEGCGACLRACPTGILRGEGTTCLSALTQAKGELDASTVALMRTHGTVWGCDECQSVCPHNRRAELSPLPFFHEARIPYLTIPILDCMDEDTFRTRAFAWRGRSVIRRNLLATEETEPTRE